MPVQILGPATAHSVSYPFFAQMDSPLTVAKSPLALNLVGLSSVEIVVVVVEYLAYGSPVMASQTVPSFLLFLVEPEDKISECVPLLRNHSTFCFLPLDHLSTALLFQPTSYSLGTLYSCGLLAHNCSIQFAAECSPLFFLSPRVLNSLEKTFEAAELKNCPWLFFY